MRVVRGRGEARAAQDDLAAGAVDVMLSAIGSPVESRWSLTPGSWHLEGPQLADLERTLPRRDAARRRRSPGAGRRAGARRCGPGTGRSARESRPSPGPGPSRSAVSARPFRGPLHQLQAAGRRPCRKSLRSSQIRTWMGSMAGSLTGCGWGRGGGGQDCADEGAPAGSALDGAGAAEFGGPLPHRGHDPAATGGMSRPDPPCPDEGRHNPSEADVSCWLVPAEAVRAGRLRR